MFGTAPPRIRLFCRPSDISSTRIACLSLSPRFASEAVNAFKFAQVMGNQGAISRQGHRSYQHVHAPDGRAPPFQHSPDTTVDLSRRPIKRYNLQRKQQCLQSTGISLPRRALFHAIVQLGNGYGRNADFTGGIRGKTLTHFRRIVLDKVDADVRVQQRGYHKL